MAMRIGVDCLHEPRRACRWPDGDTQSAYHAGDGAPGREQRRRRTPPVRATVMADAAGPGPHRGMADATNVPLGRRAAHRLNAG